MRKPVVLFVSENVTLAQVVRLVVLAGALDPARYDLHFACSAFDDFVFEGTRFARHLIPSVSRERMDRALHAGSRLYDDETLRSYLQADLALIDRLKPDLVVGDFRWTLSVACPLRQVPHVALINGYWSPHRTDRSFPLPEHPIVRLLGVRLAAIGFPIARPFVFRSFARPLNRLRVEHGFTPYPGLEELLTAGDVVLHPDIAELCPLDGAPSHHRLIGPVAWEPAADAAVLNEPLQGRARAYVTLGSSGDVRVLETALAGLETLDLDLLIATAGRATVASSKRRLVRSFLPGSAAAACSQFVVTNGGASTGYQALAAARPVLGLPFNIDQYLAMRAMERAGAALTLRSGTATATQIADAARRLLAEPVFSQRATALSRALAAVDCRTEFRAIVHDLVA